MSALLAALAAALGTFWLYTAMVLRWQGLGFGPGLSVPGAATGGAGKRAVRGGLRIGGLGVAGLDKAKAGQFAAAMAVLFVLGALVGYGLFGGIGPPLALGVFAASFLVTAHRSRQAGRRRLAGEAWPRMISEIRLQTGSMGRSIPHALFDVGRRAPADMRPAFEAAQREWRLTTDLVRATGILKKRLADASADMVCETLLIAHELGGHELDERLEALAEDRFADLAGRKDARSRQAGARFARVFVLVVPFGMALAGVSIGNGRDAYASGTGQAVVSAALLMVTGCWFWAGRIMRLPETDRVFSE